MTLGERLLEYRTNAKLSQDALAEKIGVTRQTISKWETDQSTPEFNKILPLCELYGITTDELIKGEKQENNNQEKETVSYSERRNKLKAIIISVSVALYCIGAFIPIYLVEILEYNDAEAAFILLMLWTIATVILVYFFISHPKEKNEEKQVKIKEKEVSDKDIKQSNKIENGVVQVIALLFLVIYMVVSFITMAWYITWILWLVFALVVAIVKLIFDIKKGENNGK